MPFVWGIGIKKNWISKKLSQREHITIEQLIAKNYRFLETSVCEWTGNCELYFPVLGMEGSVLQH